MRLLSVETNTCITHKFSWWLLLRLIVLLPYSPAAWTPRLNICNLKILWSRFNLNDLSGDDVQYKCLCVCLVTRKRFAYLTAVFSPCYLQGDKVVCQLLAVLQSIRVGHVFLMAYSPYLQKFDTSQKFDGHEGRLVNLSGVKVQDVPLQ